MNKPDKLVFAVNMPPFCRWVQDVSDPGWTIRTQRCGRFVPKVWTVRTKGPNDSYPRAGRFVPNAFLFISIYYLFVFFRTQNIRFISFLRVARFIPFFGSFAILSPNRWVRIVLGKKLPTGYETSIMFTVVFFLY